MHGISTEHAQLHGRPVVEVLTEVDRRLQGAWWSGCPVVAFNAVFDLTILDREMRRHLDRPLIVSGPVIDPLILDKQMDRFRRGSRKLIDMCTHYGVALSEEDAHSADADCLAATRLAWMLGNRHSQLAEMNLEVLHDAQVDWYAEQRSSFADYRRKQGKPLDDNNTVWPLKPYVEAEVPV